MSETTAQMFNEIGNNVGMTPIATRAPEGTELSKYGKERASAYIGDINKLPDVGIAMANLDKLIAEESRSDIPTYVNDMVMFNDGMLNIKEVPFDYTYFALSQLVTMIKPNGVSGLARYLSVCPGSLRATNYNYWHKENLETLKKVYRIMRLRCNTKPFTIRGLVSEQYKHMDDLESLKSVAGMLDKDGKMSIQRDDVRSRYKIIWPNQQELSVGDVISAGINISNSEVTAGSFRIEPMAYQIACFNCTIIPMRTSEIVIRHVGDAKDRIGAAIKDSTSKIQPFIDAFRIAYKDTFQQDYMEEMFESVKDRFDFSEKKMELIKSKFDEFEKKNGLTRAGVVNAITRAAQSFGAEVGEEMQRAAGLLVMEGWKK